MRLLRALVVLAGLLGITLLARADGFILPNPIVPLPPEQHLRPLEIEYHKVTIQVADGLAHFTVDQVFRNPHTFALEGTYFFPLPRDAVVEQFSLWDGEHKLTGEVLGKEKARRLYLDLVRRLKDPALLEYVERDLFKASLFPIPPKGERRIQLKYTQVLPVSGGLYKVDYPLDTERFSATPLDTVEINLKLHTTQPLGAIYSPTHKVKVERLDATTAKVTWQAEKVLPDKDFRLYFGLKQHQVGLNLLCYRLPPEPGFFLALLAPGVAEQHKVLPKDIVFVLDVSGSMSGVKIEQAKAALETCLQALGKDDRFNVVSFNATAVRLFEKARKADSRAREKAVDFTRSFEAGGSTNIDEALKLALESLPAKSDRPRFVLCLTDGRPTAGETDENSIVDNFKRRNEKAQARLFMFGVGYNVNTHLVDKLSNAGHGSTEYVTESDEVEQAITALYARLAHPAVTNVKLAFEDLEVFHVYPETPGDLFYGDQVLILGRYKQPGKGKLRLTGTCEGTPVQFERKVVFPGRAIEAKSVPRLWAARRIGYLLDTLRLEGESQALKDEIVQLAERYGLVTPFTSILVQDYAGANYLKAVPQGAGYGGVAPGMVMKQRTGKGAVTLAQEVQAAKQQAQVGMIQGEAAKVVKLIADKTFYLVEGWWVDSAVTPNAPVLQIVYGSEAYFALLNRYPALGPYLALGRQVRVKVGTTCLEVGPEGRVSLSAEELDQLAPGGF